MNAEAPMVRSPARLHPSQTPLAAHALAAILLLASLACGDSTGPEVDLLSEQRALWETLGLQDYAYDVQRVCFCLVREGVRVTVMGGAVTGATDLATGEVLEPNEVQWYLTVDGLFDILQDAYDRNAHEVQVEFDPNRGYPTRIFIDYSEMIADEELGFTLLGEVRALAVGLAVLSYRVS